MRDETRSVAPAEGMGATLYLETDVAAATVASVAPDGQTCVLQLDRAVPVDRARGVYRYERDTLGLALAAVRTVDGWEVTGLRQSIGVRLGYRRACRDRSLPFGPAQATQEPLDAITTRRWR